MTALVDAIRSWVKARDDLRALALAGSWATGNARPGSDVDLLIVASEPDDYRRPREWLNDIGFSEAGFEIERYETAIYGAVWSCHTFLKPGAEVELTFAAPAWTSTSPIDDGTRSVVADGFQVIVDKDGALARLAAAIQAEPMAGGSLPA